jgi:hypothetical protein
MEVCEPIVRLDVRKLDGIYSGDLFALFSFATPLNRQGRR